MANFHYRLLIVDDEPISRDLLQSSPSRKGFDVCIAKDGFAALAQMHGALPDLIVSDLRELRTLECIFCEAQVQFIVEEMPEAAGLPMIEER